MALAIAAATGYHITTRDQSWRRGRMGLLDRRQRGAADCYLRMRRTSAVIDLDANKVVGDIPDTPGVHGIAIAPELNRGLHQQRPRQQRDDLRSEDAEADRHGARPARIRIRSATTRGRARVRLQRPVEERDGDRREDRRRRRRRFRCPASRSSRSPTARARSTSTSRTPARSSRSTPPRRPSLKKLTR